MNERSARPGGAAAFGPRPVPPKKPIRRAAAASLEPTILLVGADSIFEPGLRAALARHRVYVETTAADNVAQAVLAAAPDLVLLVGPAARDGGSAVLAALRSSPLASMIPVAVLDDHAALGARLSAFRHGAAAVIPRSASIDAIAEQVERLAREIPGRGGESLGVIGEATLSEFVSALSSELRSGILSEHSAGENDEAVRLVLGSGRPLAAFIDDFVRQVKSHVVHAEPLRYEFNEHAGGTVALLDTAACPEERRRANVKGVRVALADDDTARADTVAQELRARGAFVVVTDLAPSELRFAKLRQVDPELILIGEAQLKGQGYELLRRMRRDTRLRWASLLVVRWDEIWTDALAVPTLARLETAISALSEADRTLQGSAETGQSFDAQLETTGPARCLRALSKSMRPLRMSADNPRITVNVDISDGLIVGAMAESRSEPSEHWDGALALSAFMVLSSGRLHIAPAIQPATANVMATVDVALNMADSEQSPISASVPDLGPASVYPPAAAQAATPRAASPPATQPASVEKSVPFRRLVRARIGVSKPAAAFLIALAALQGLLVVLALRILFKPHRPGSSAPTLTSSASLSSSLAAAPHAALPVVSPVGSGILGATPAANLAVPTPTQAAPSAPAEAQIPLDETGVRAPTCGALLGSTGVNKNAAPGAAFAQIRDANKALVRGDLDAAERNLCKAVLWDQKNPAVPLELAQLMLLRRDGESAVEWAHHGLERDAAGLRAQAILGDGLARLGDYPGAKSAWLKSMRLEEASPEQIKSLSFASAREAQASMKRHDFARAERFFRRAIVLDGDNRAACNGLANALLRLGDTASALRWANHAVAVAPRDPAARVLLGDVLFQKGDRSGAEVEWREALDQDPSNFLATLRINKLTNTR